MTGIVNKVYTRDESLKRIRKKKEQQLGGNAVCASSLPCLVPRPHYLARPKRFRSRGPSEAVFPARSLRTRHRSELIERAWENAVQRLPIIRLNCTHINPLSPKIHIQILQTDLHTFLLRIVERIWFKIKVFSF